MRIFTRLSLLAICLVFCGASKESIYLEYSIERLNPQEILDRQMQKSDQGYPLGINVRSIHPEEIIKSTEDNHPYTKGQRAYSQKNTLY